MTNIRIERFDAPHDLPKSVVQFWAEATGQHPMRSPAWLASWWNSYSVNAPKHGCIYALFLGQLPIAVAPFYVRQAVPGIRSLRLMGDKGICSDHSSLIVDPAHESIAIQAIAETLMGHMGKNWDTLCFEAVDLEDKTLNRLITRMQKLKLRFTSENALDCWAVELPSSWDEYLMSISKNHRKRCRRWQKEFFDTGRAVIVDVPADNWQQGWQRLVELNRLRRSKKNDKSAFDDARFLDCHQDFLDSAIRDSKATIRELYLDQTHVASEYLLLGTDTIYCYQSGMVTAEDGIGFGNLSVMATIRQAIEQGYTRLDLLRGDEDYKHHWGAEPHHTITWRASAQSVSGSVYRGLREAVELLRDLKSLLRSSLSSSIASGNARTEA